MALTYEKIENEQFINPYNFVELRRMTAKESAKNRQEIVSGSIECHMKAVTPIAILDTEKREEDKDVKEHFQYPFMSVGTGEEKKYIIPGSSIRGVVRNVYETITESCFATLKEDYVLTRRLSSKEHFDPAIIEIKQNDAGENTYKLFSADRYMLNYKCDKQNSGKKYTVSRKKDRVCLNLNGKELKTGNEVRFNPVKDGTNDRYYVNRRGVRCAKIVNDISPNGEKSGYLYLGEEISNKHHESVFVKGIEIQISSEKIQKALKAMEFTLEMYRNKSINKQYEDGHCGYPEYEQVKKDKCIPIWYQFDERSGNLYLSLAAIGRRAFFNTLNDKMPGKNACDSRENMCPACSLFGMIGEKSNASHVRFSDAICINSNEKINTSYITLTELASPHVSYSPFYANNPQYDDPNTKFRGRKFYWNTNNFDSNKQITKTNRNASVQLAGVGAEFDFVVYFDCISKEELATLLWSMNFGKNDIDDKTCLKIGHGKPIGLGSVKCIAEKVVVRTYSEGKYEIIDDMLDDLLSTKIDMRMKTEKQTDLITISTYKEDLPVKYPYVLPENGVNVEKLPEKQQKDYASFHWFSEANNDRDDGTRLRQSLPTIQDIDKGKRLCAYQKINNNGNNRNENVAHNNQNQHREGYCQDCGKPTKNGKDGRPYRYCFECNQRRQNRR